VKAFITNLTS